MHRLNLGILAHVDAGKTSLTERLLFETGTIAALGSVDAGTTRTDTMALERRRGITIRTNVASFTLGDETGRTHVNLIDTPGHRDFIADVERSLGVLDAAVLVISAVQGVQPQTVVLWRAMRRLGLPVLIFINKIDRRGADVARVSAEIERRLARPSGTAVLPLTSVQDESTSEAEARSLPLGADGTIDVLADADERVVRAVLAGRRMDERQLARTARRLVGSGAAVPVLAGSALTGAGVAGLLQRLPQLLPWTRPAGARLSAVVFKIDRSAGRTIAWARVFAGTLRVRDRHQLGGRRPERITSLRVAEPGGLAETNEAGPGDVVALGGLGSARVGDWLGEPCPGRVTRQFPAPTLEAVVEPVDPTQRGLMHQALADLAEADPLIDVHLDDDRGEVSVRLYGEVQKQVIGALLDEEFGVPCLFRETTTVHIERIVGRGADKALMPERLTPYLASLGSRLEAVPPGTGVVVDLEAELGSMPPAFFAATREGIGTGLAQGRFGWPIPDARVVITHTGYVPRQSAMHQKFNKNMSSIGADFRLLAPILVHTALALAGTVVCEPIERSSLQVPTWAVSPVTAAVANAEGIIGSTNPGHDEIDLVGHIPTRTLRGLVQQLPDLARGEAVLVTELDHFAAVTGRPPVRRRVGPDPLDRETWFRERPR